MTSNLFRTALAGFAMALTVCACNATNAAQEQERHASSPAKSAAIKGVKAQYLEIVTPEAEATCAALEKIGGIKFGPPIAEFGMARTAPLVDGGLLGVRGPMHAAENTVVRPYLLVEDIVAAVEAAKASGGEIAMPPTEIPGGRGQFAIYFLGGIEHGIWQL